MTTESISPRAAVIQALVDAGFAEGARPAPDANWVVSKSKGGFVIDVTRFDGAAFGAASFLAIDAVGPGRGATLAAFAVALSAAGLASTLAPVKLLSKKLVLRVALPAV